MKQSTPFVRKRSMNSLSLFGLEYLNHKEDEKKPQDENICTRVNSLDTICHEIGTSLHGMSQPLDYAQAIAAGMKDLPLVEFQASLKRKVDALKKFSEYIHSSLRRLNNFMTTGKSSDLGHCVQDEKMFSDFSSQVIPKLQELLQASARLQAVQVELERLLSSFIELNALFTMQLNNIADRILNILPLIKSGVKAISQVIPGSDFHLTEIEHRPAKIVKLTIGLNVMVVDDTIINRELLTKILKKRGHKVYTAADGEKAVKLFSQLQEQIDIIFMDLLMPNMDGYEATQQIREQESKSGKRIPIIALTASASTSENRLKAQAVGIDDFQTKPFDHFKIDMLINKHVKKPLQPVNKKESTQAPDSPVSLLLSSIGITHDIHHIPTNPGIENLSLGLKLAHD